MPKILYFVAEDWAFVSHFRPMAQAARACGLDVVVATRVHQHGAAIVGEGYRLVALESRRGTLNPVALLKSILEMARVIRGEQPTIVHCVSLPMAVLGGLAARATGRRHIVLSLTGLGYVWVENGVLAAIVRAIARRIIGFLLGHPGTVLVCENAEDPREFGLDPSDPKVVLVGGAGVDPQAFQFEGEPPSPPVKVALLSRMIKPKGIAEAVAAVERARELGAAVELHLYGVPDPSNRTTLTETDLRRWARAPGIHWHGATDDVARVHREHHIAMLLSVREGLPKSLVEAAAAGRPIVASDVPGCREVVRHEREGYLVRFGDIDGAAQALVALAADGTLRRRLGEAAHARFQARFTVAAVQAVFIDLYASLMAVPDRKRQPPVAADPPASLPIEG
ncbi:MAG TPA: glycosyltransferase family 4 protein [Xanthobacteraceae bacterium]|jgi:glycosyltransferase involved in cell wall biosynthesis